MLCLCVLALAHDAVQQQAHMPLYMVHTPLHMSLDMLHPDQSSALSEGPPQLQVLGRVFCRAVDADPCDCGRGSKREGEPKASI